MDTVTDFTGRLTPALNITRFVIAGLSKVSQVEVYLYLSNYIPAPYPPTYQRPIHLHTSALSTYIPAPYSPTYQRPIHLHTSALSTYIPAPYSPTYQRPIHLHTSALSIYIPAPYPSTYPVNSPQSYM